MKITLAIAVLMSSLALGQSNELVRDSKKLFVDNVIDKSSGEDFAKAFAQEPTCSGLTLILWTSRVFDTDAQLNLSELWAGSCPIATLLALDTVVIRAGY